MLSQTRIHYSNQIQPIIIQENQSFESWERRRLKFVLVSKEGNENPVTIDVTGFSFPCFRETFLWQPAPKCSFGSLDLKKLIGLIRIIGTQWGLKWFRASKGSLGQKGSLNYNPFIELKSNENRRGLLELKGLTQA